RILRPPLPGHATVVVRERPATAVRAAGKDAGGSAVERRQEALDVLRHPERLRAGIVVGRNDAIDVCRERRPLVGGEVLTPARGPGALDTGDRCRERGEEHAERLQELSATEEHRHGGYGRQGGPALVVSSRWRSEASHGPYRWCVALPVNRQNCIDPTSPGGVSHLRSRKRGT